MSDSRIPNSQISIKLPYADYDRTWFQLQWPVALESKQILWCNDT